MVLIQRSLRWRTDLLSWSMAQLHQPFVWGKTDCGTLAREALRIMFARDMTPWLPAWSSRKEAVAVLREHGKIEEQIARLGPTAASLGFVRAGDLIVEPEPDERVGRRAVYVCVDGCQLLMSSREGVGLINSYLLNPESKVYSLWAVREACLG